MFGIGETVKFKEDGALGTIIWRYESGYLVAWEDRVLSWATKEQLGKLRGSIDEEVELQKYVHTRF